MTLPQETQQAIANRAAEYADQQHANDGDDIHIGYLAGATEWAGKAQSLVDALEALKEGSEGHTIRFIDNALAKYKEVKPEPVKPVEYMPVHPEHARLSGCPKQFPMHLLSAEQAYSNHSQTLQRLKERGGLSVHEMLAVANKKPCSFYSKLMWEDALKMLNDMINKEVTNG